MNIPFLGKKIKWYNMSDLNETELKKGFFRPNQKFVPMIPKDRTLS